jgi:serine/threonine protein kinase
MAGPYGSHLCFVMGAEGFSIDDFRRSNLKTKFLRLHVVQLVVSQLLVALSHLHEIGLIHTGRY